jgi:cell division protein FtsQ
MPTLGGLRMGGAGPTAGAAVRWLRQRASGLVPRRLKRLAEKIERRQGRPWGQFAAAGFLAAFAGYGLVAGGHLPRLAMAGLNVAGLGIENVRIAGQAETSQLAILERLDTGGQALPTFDAAAARERVAALPWVADVTVRKLYPDTLEVAVVERIPFALWQNDGEIHIVDREGTAIAPFVEPRFAKLPLVVGEGANRRAASFLAEIAAQPHIAQRMRAAVLVGGRRWDIVLDDDMVVKLPESGADDAIAEIVRLDQQHQLLSRDVSALDLRLPDRITVHVPEKGKPGRPGSLAEAARTGSGGSR